MSRCCTVVCTDCSVLICVGVVGLVLSGASTAADMCGLRKDRLRAALRTQKVKLIARLEDFNRGSCRTVHECVAVLADMGFCSRGGGGYIPVSVGMHCSSDDVVRTSGCNAIPSPQHTFCAPKILHVQYGQRVEYRGMKVCSGG